MHSSTKRRDNGFSQPLILLLTSPRKICASNALNFPTNEDGSTFEFLNEYPLEAKSFTNCIIEHDAAASIDELALPMQLLHYHHHLLPLLLQLQHPALSLKELVAAHYYQKTNHS